MTSIRDLGKELRTILVAGGAPVSRISLFGSVLLSDRTPADIDVLVETSDANADELAATIRLAAWSRQVAQVDINSYKHHQGDQRGVVPYHFLIVTKASARCEVREHADAVILDLWEHER